MILLERLRSVAGTIFHGSIGHGNFRPRTKPKPWGLQLAVAQICKLSKIGTGIPSNTRHTFMCVSFQCNCAYAVELWVKSATGPTLPASTVQHRRTGVECQSIMLASRDTTLCETGSRLHMSLCPIPSPLKPTNVRLP